MKHYDGKRGSFDYDDSQFKLNRQGYLIYVGKETDGAKIQIPQGITDISGMFKGSKLTTPPVIPTSVDNMTSTFENCTELQSTPDLSKLDLLTEMNSAFAGCTALKESSPIPGGVAGMLYAFKDCKSLKELPALPATVSDYKDLIFEGCPEQKRQQAIREHREHKKEKTGLSNPVIAYSMGGAVKSPYVPEAGIRVVEYDASLPLDKILRNEQENIAVAVGDVIGGDETGKEKFLVGKPVAKDGKSYLPMIYAGFTSENEGEIDEAVRYLVEHTIKDSKLPDGSFVGRQGWELTDEIYRPTESQLQNAVERYTPSIGTWMGKNIDKPIALDTSLVKEMEHDGLQNEGNSGLG